MSARSRRLGWGAALCLVVGCGTPGDTESGEAAGASTPVEGDRAVAVALAIRANPARTDSILTAYGLTREGLDSLMYEVAENDVRARAYTEALKR